MFLLNERGRRRRRRRSAVIAPLPVFESDHNSRICVTNKGWEIAKHRPSHLHIV